MRLEHHLVGGYVRYISPHIIIIIIIINSFILFYFICLLLFFKQYSVTSVNQIG